MYIIFKLLKVQINVKLLSFNIFFNYITRFRNYIQHDVSHFKIFTFYTFQFYFIASTYLKTSFYKT